MGVLTEADGQALEGLCEAYAELRLARASLAAAGGMIFETTNQAGDVMLRVRPEMKVIADADRRFAMWCSRFGLTPADRSRVSAKLSDDRGQFAEFGT
jgi:P27 family predicted phage terminase small subunit